MSTGPTFCWCCRKPLEAASTGKDRGWLVYAVLVDQLGHEHRVHKKCAANATDKDCEWAYQEGVKFLRNERTPRVELP